MNTSWPKVKNELWAYGEKGIGDVRDKVVHHLTTSSYHELRKDDAWDCMLQFEKDEEPIVQCEEAQEERDAYRGWKDALVEKLAQRKGDAASEITTALRSCTEYATRKKPATSMLRDAIDSIDHVAGDDDDYHDDDYDFMRDATKKQRADVYGVDNIQKHSGSSMNVFCKLCLR